MISLLPQKTKTLVLALPFDVVVYLLEKATTPLEDAPQQYTSLMGWVKGDHFQITSRARRPNAFVPIATGRIEPTSTGCIVFLDYRLLPPTRFYLVFWSVVILLSGTILAVYYSNFLLWLASVAILGFINGTAWANFKLHWKPLHNTLVRALEETI